MACLRGKGVPLASFQCVFFAIFATAACLYIFMCCVALKSAQVQTASADASGPFSFLSSWTSGMHGGSSGGARRSGSDARVSVRAELGRGTWNMLHRLAAQFPDHPSPEKQREAEQFFQLIGALYPCSECAEHFRGMLQRSPVRSANATLLSIWLCERHNEVNMRLKKPLFPCEPATLKEKWGDCGCSDRSADAEAASPSVVAVAAAGRSLMRRQ